MIENHFEDFVDFHEIFRHLYRKRRLIFHVFIVSLLLSFLYSSLLYLFSPPVYQYTSQTVLEVNVIGDNNLQKALFISFLTERALFESSAKSIGLAVDYDSWRNNIRVEDVRNSNIVNFYISSRSTNKLVALNRRIVSNAIFRTKDLLTDIKVNTIDESKLDPNPLLINKRSSFLENALIFVFLSVAIVIGWLNFQIISNRNIKRTKDLAFIGNLEVIGTIPDYDKLIITEEINFKSFVRGLVWKRKK
jgi:capsular polysaccharide biosynthesis protein